MTNSIPSLRVVRLKVQSPENEPQYLTDTGLKFNELYVVLGEISKINHYLILNYRTGHILPGMFHLSRFEEVPDDDL